MYQINILVAEDEERLRKLLVKYFKSENYHVTEAADGGEALRHFGEENIDLIILDVMMPVMDGWQVLNQIRKTSTVPVIMLTANGEEDDKIFGFDLGADDYVTKPFSPRELIARAKALLKRTGKVMVENEITLGSLSIDQPSRRVLLSGDEIELTPKEYDLLLFFIDNVGRALTREQILNRVWGYDYFGDDRTVDTVVKRLRKKLLDEGQRIHTIRGVGYRLDD